MKNLFLIISYLSAVNISMAQVVYDNFDNYSAGEYICPQSRDLWTTWGNNPGGSEDAYVTDEFSYSNNNSLKLSSRSSSDLVLPLGSINSGMWELSFMMRVESGHGAYFNLLHEISGNQSNWAFESYFSQTGLGTFTVGIGGITRGFTYPTGEWFNVKVSVDVDENNADLTINDITVYDNWAWCLGSDISGNNLPLDSTIAALNLVSVAPEGEEALFYVDDVSFQQMNLGIKDLSNAVSLYPNPVSNQLIIDSEGLQGATCEIVSVLGAQVYKKLLSSNQEFVDCSTWIPGVYFLQIAAQSGSVQRNRFMVE